MLSDYFQQCMRIRTYTRDSISRVSRMTGTVERSLGVGTVRINMAIVCVMTMVYCQSRGITLVDICHNKHKDDFDGVRTLKNHLGSISV